MEVCTLFELKKERMEQHLQATVCRKCDLTQATNVTNTLSSTVRKGSVIIGPSAKSPICKIEDQTHRDVRKTVEKIGTMTRQLSNLEALDNCDQTKASQVANLIKEMDAEQTEVTKDVRLVVN